MAKILGGSPRRICGHIKPGGGKKVGFRFKDGIQLTQLKQI